MAKITSIRQYTDIQPDGTFIQKMEVTYEVEDVGTFTLTMPKEGFSSQKARQMVQAEEREILQAMR